MINDLESEDLEDVLTETEVQHLGADKDGDGRDDGQGHWGGNLKVPEVCGHATLLRSLLPIVQRSIPRPGSKAAHAEKSHNKHGRQGNGPLLRTNMVDEANDRSPTVVHDSGFSI